MPNHYRKLRFSFFSEITAVPDFLSQRYYRALDGFRGMAILMVVFAHIGVNHYAQQAGLYIDSHFGVYVFFVLSGFLITTLLMKEKVSTGSISLKYFYLRRSLKIIPIAYLFLVVVIALVLCYQLDLPLSDFLASFFFLKNLPVKNQPLTAHFWTLAAEEQFYLVFPLLLAASNNKYLYAALSIVTVVPLVATLGYFQLIDPHYLPVKIMMYLFWKGPVMILIGSVWAIFLFKGMTLNLKISKYYLTDLMLFVLAIVIQNKRFIGYIPYVSEWISALIIAYSLASVIKNQSLLSIILESRLLVNTGIISYSLYIWQQLFIGQKAWQPWLYSLRNQPLYLLMLAKLMLIFAIGFLSWRFVEKRFLKLKVHFSRSTFSATAKKSQLYNRPVQEFQDHS